jgi:hypothetical protein
MNALRFTSHLIVAVVVLFVVGSGPASAQSNCAPFSGTVHGAYYKVTGETSKAWHMVGDFAIGKDVYFAKISVKNTSMHQETDIWQGTETWTFDFGEGNTIQLTTDFVTEHMYPPSGGIYHIREVGTFVNGTGAFKNAFGNLAADGPFGPNVKLYNIAQLPPAATTMTMFWVAPSQGMICGLNNREP